MTWQSVMGTLSSALTRMPHPAEGLALSAGARLPACSTHYHTFLPLPQIIKVGLG